MQLQDARQLTLQLWIASRLLEPAPAGLGAHNALNLGSGILACLGEGTAQLPRFSSVIRQVRTPHTLNSALLSFLRGSHPTTTSIRLYSCSYPSTLDAVFEFGFRETLMLCSRIAWLLVACMDPAAISRRDGLVGIQPEVVDGQGKR